MVYIELNHHGIMSKQTNIFITHSDITDATDNKIPENNQGTDLKKKCCKFINILYSGNIC